MEIKHCNVCGADWCYRGSGRALRCGKCKSPYWDKERVYVGVASGEGAKEARVKTGNKEDLNEINSVGVARLHIDRISPSRNTGGERIASGVSGTTALEASDGNPGKDIPSKGDTVRFYNERSEVEHLCGFESWNEQDGENYRCMLPTHGSKVKHGCWRKV